MILIYDLYLVSSFFERERERERAMGEGQRERLRRRGGRENVKQAPHWGGSWGVPHGEIMTWVEIKSLMLNWLSHPGTHIWFSSERYLPGGAWVAQLVKCPALDIGSDHDLIVRGTEPCIGLCADTVDPAWDSLSPSLSASSPFALFMSLKINKKNFF